MTEDNAEGQETALSSQNLVSVEITLPKDVLGALKPLTVKMAESDTISDLTLTLGLFFTAIRTFPRLLMNCVPFLRLFQL